MTEMRSELSSREREKEKERRRRKGRSGIRRRKINRKRKIRF